MAPSLRLTALLLLLPATACHDPLCEDDPLPSETASDVRLELRGAGRAGRPVFVHAHDGTLLDQGETDADGGFAIDTVPGDSSLTVDVGRGSFDGEDVVRLVSYVGLTSGDQLIFQTAEPRGFDDGSVLVTVRFPQLDAPGISGYDIQSGLECAALLPFPHDPELPAAAMREIEIDARCLQDTGAVMVTALGADQEFLGLATQTFEVGPSSAVTVEVGPWQTATATLSFVGFPSDAYLYVRAEVPGIGLYYRQAPLDQPQTIPDLPGVFDRVQVSVRTPTAPERSYQVSLADPSDVVIDAADLLPAIEAFEVEGVASAAPTVSWHYRGPMLAAIATYSIDETSLHRTAIRVDGGCHVRFPPLPDEYRQLVPTGGEDFSAVIGVSLDDAPDLDNAHDLLRPLDTLPAGVGVSATETFRRVTLHETPDPS